MAARRPYRHEDRDSWPLNVHALDTGRSVHLYILQDLPPRRYAVRSLCGQINDPNYLYGYIPPSANHCPLCQLHVEAMCDTKCYASTGLRTYTRLEPPQDVVDD